MKIGFISLGCSKNLVDSEKMMGMLKSGHHELVKDAQEAEAIIINTCGFINSAKEEAINTIFKMAVWRNVIRKPWRQKFQKSMPSSVFANTRIYMRFFTLYWMGKNLSAMAKVSVWYQASHGRHI